MQKVSLGVQSQGETPGHGDSCFSQTPSHQDPSWLRGACAPKRRVLRQNSQGRQNKMIGQKEDKDQENCPFIKNFPKGDSPSQFACVSFCMYFVFPINFYFSLYLLHPHLNSFLTRQERTRGPSHGHWPLWSSG